MAIVYVVASAVYKDIGYRKLEAVYNLQGQDDGQIKYVSTVTVQFNGNGRVVKQPSDLDLGSALGQAIKNQVRADATFARNRGVKSLLNSRENPHNRALKQAHSQLRQAVK